MKLIGLTGGIASGKSTVSQIIRDSGYTVLDADRISRYVSQPGTMLFRSIVEEFDVETEDGQLDRQKLGDLIFSDPEKRKRLDSLIHPVIHEKALSLIEEYRQEGCKVLFYEVPLLFESNLQEMFDFVIVVYTTTAIQVQRLMARNNLSEEEAFSRVSSQWTPESRLQKADYCLINMGSENDLKDQVAELLPLLILE